MTGRVMFSCEKISRFFAIAGDCLRLSCGRPNDETLSAQQRDGDIVDVGACRPGLDQAAGRFERMVGVVGRKYSGDLHTLRTQAGKGAAVNISSRRIRRTVRSVTADGEDCRTGKTCDAGGGRKGQFLIAAAHAFAGEMDDGFAAGDKGQRRAVRSAGAASIEAAGLAGAASGAAPASVSKACVRRMLARKLPASRASQQS